MSAEKGVSHGPARRILPCEVRGIGVIMHGKVITTGLRRNALLARLGLGFYVEAV